MQKQDKYTMDPRRQIYLNNNNKKFWSKLIFEQNKKKLRNFFLRKNFGKKIFDKNFL